MSATHRIGLLLLVGFAFVLGNTFAGAQKAEPGKAKEIPYEYSLDRNLTYLVNVEHTDEKSTDWEVVEVFAVENGIACLCRRPKDGMRPKWEVVALAESDFKKFDSRGWEFVGCAPGQISNMAYFKRPKK